MQPFDISNPQTTTTPLLYTYIHVHIALALANFSPCGYYINFALWAGIKFLCWQKLSSVFINFEGQWFVRKNFTSLPLSVLSKIYRDIQEKLSMWINWELVSILTSQWRKPSFIPRPLLTFQCSQEKHPMNVETFGVQLHGDEVKRNLEHNYLLPHTMNWSDERWCWRCALLRLKSTPSLFQSHLQSLEGEREDWYGPFSPDWGDVGHTWPDCWHRWEGGRVGSDTRCSSEWREMNLHRPLWPP